MDAESISSQVALLMDWENIHLGLQDVKRSPNISAIMEEAQSLGKVVIARAYADFSYETMRAVPENLYRVGIEPVYVFGRTSGIVQKNSVDMKLAADCMDVCYRYPDINIYILVTGDGDFIHLVNALKPHGKTIVIVTLSWSASTRLIGSADVVKYYDRVIDPVVEDSAEPPPRLEVATSDEPDAPLTEERVYEAIRGVVEEQGGSPILLAALKQVLIQQIPNFDQVQLTLGFPKFKTMMLHARHKGYVEIETKDMVDWARPVGSASEAASYTTQPTTYEASTTYQPAASQLPLDDIKNIVRLSDHLERTRPYITFGYLVDNISRQEWATHLERRDIQDRLDLAVNHEALFVKESYERFDEYQRRMVEIPTLRLDREHNQVQAALGMRQYLIPQGIVQTPDAAGGDDQGGY